MSTNNISTYELGILSFNLKYFANSLPSAFVYVVFQYEPSTFSKNEVTSSSESPSEDSFLSPETLEEHPRFKLISNEIAVSVISIFEIDP